MVGRFGWRICRLHLAVFATTLNLGQKKGAKAGIKDNESRSIEAAPRFSHLTTLCRNWCVCVAFCFPFSLTSFAHFFFIFFAFLLASWSAKCRRVVHLYYNFHGRKKGEEITEYPKTIKIIPRRSIRLFFFYTETWPFKSDLTRPLCGPQKFTFHNYQQKKKNKRSGKKLKLLTIIF